MKMERSLLILKYVWISVVVVGAIYGLIGLAIYMGQEVKPDPLPLQRFFILYVLIIVYIGCIGFSIEELSRLRNLNTLNTKK